MLYICTLSIIGIILLLIIIIYKGKEKNSTNNNKTNNKTNNKNSIENFQSSFGNSDIHTYENLSNNSDTPWTIDKNTKLKVIDIIKHILHNINKQTNMSYYFTTFDQLRQEPASADTTVNNNTMLFHKNISKTQNNNTHRFTADFFAHEMKTLVTRRILLVFTVDYITNDVNVEYVNLSNAFKNPSKSFMDYDTPSLILQDDNLLKNTYKIMGQNKSKIDFSMLKDCEILQKDVPTPIEFQKWILPMGVDAAYQNPQKLFPASAGASVTSSSNINNNNNNKMKYWDTNGVYYHKTKNNNNNNNNNNILTTTNSIKNTCDNMYYPYFNPTVNLQKTFDSEYKWLYDLSDNTSGRGGHIM